MFRRSKSIYDQEFCLLPGDSVIVNETTQVEGGLLRVTKEHFRYVAEKAETLRIRLDVS